MAYVQKNVLENALLQTIADDIKANPDGETAASSEASVTLGSQGAITLTLPSVTGQSAWGIYRATTSGGETLLDIVRGDTTTYIDDGSLTAGTKAAPSAASGNVYGLTTPSPPSGAVTTLPFQDYSLSPTTPVSDFVVGGQTIAFQQFYPNFKFLKEVRFEALKDGTPGADLQIDIVEGSSTDNKPTATSLGSTTVAEASIGGTYASVTATFSTPITLTKGKMYYIRWKIVGNGGDATTNRYRIKGIGSQTGLYLGKAAGVNTLFS